MEDRAKLHRWLLRLDGRDLTVLTLRPGSTARYATNVFHGTPHVLTDVAGAQVLGRLLWGLAYQRRPQTAVLIDRPQLDPNPFDAEPSVPALFALADRTVLDTAMLRALRRRLPLTGAPHGTVGWHTPGLHDPGDHRVDGEVQVFTDYAERVEVARAARAEVLAEPDAPTDPAAVREAVWTRGAAIRSRRAPQLARGDQR